MRGKRGLIMGVANNRSIAWGIAKARARHGAELAFTYQGDALKKRVEPLAARSRRAVGGPLRRHRRGLARCGVRGGQIRLGVARFRAARDRVLDKDQLAGRYVETTAENFNKTLAISCYSFTAVAQRAES
jgi:enoyl-[acyl-carrier protein] reductase I